MTNANAVVIPALGLAVQTTCSGAISRHAPFKFLHIAIFPGGTPTGDERTYGSLTGGSLKL